MGTGIVGIIGSGNIGRDPFDPKAWSGSSKYFFESCRKLGILKRAFGVEVPIYTKIPLLLKNLSFNRSKWATKLYLDTRYYDALTSEISRRLTPTDFDADVLQIGAIYNVPKVVRGRCSCYSYHDGNLAQAIRSPYWSTTISKRTIQKALDYERDVYAGMDSIFTMSEYLRRSFIDDFGVPEVKVTTIGAGVNLETMPAIIPKDYDRKTVLFVGVDFQRKGGPQLLEAFRLVRSAIPEAILHIVGPPRLAVPTELSAGVEFHGFLSKKDPEQRKTFERLYRESSLFVLPSRYEPFGIAPLEAMAYEVPCILSENWAFPEMVRVGITGVLVPCDDVQELAEAILSCLRDPNSLSVMGHAARLMVLEKYTWDAVVGRLIEKMGMNTQGIKPEHTEQG